MSSSNFNWGDDTIYSRDIIARYEELNDELESLEETLQEWKDEYEEFLTESSSSIDFDQEKFDEECDKFKERIDEAQADLNDFNSSFERDELDTLKEVIAQGEDASDWNYGEGLIHENYFTQYTEDLVNDCWEKPEELTTDTWPWCHMHMDWEAAAEDLKQDYLTIEVQGNTYYIKS